MTLKIYVEGGGDHNKALQTQCRQGFSEFLRRAGLEGRMPKVVACGGRAQAYRSFRTSQESAGREDFPVLLVDSEEPVVQTNHWEHVRVRHGDGWERPANASQEQIHFMVQSMEAWFHADKNVLADYYGRGFQPSALSRRDDIENIPKADLIAGLCRATKDCRKGEYSKGEHSFSILARLDPARIRAASAHAERFLTMLDQKCQP